MFQKGHYKGQFSEKNVFRILAESLTKILTVILNNVIIDCLKSRNSRIPGQHHHRLCSFRGLNTENHGTLKIRIG